MSKYLIILTTACSKKEALLLTNKLLTKKLCACVNITGSVESHYWWKKKVNKAKEWMLFIKTESKLFGKVKKEIKQHHSYDVPEIIALPVIRGSKNYLDWISSSIK